MKNDGHDTSIQYSDKWLARTFSKVFTNKKVLKDTLFIITFDEDDYMGNNRVYTAFIGDAVKAGYTSKQRYNHYSLLKTIEAIYDLDNLGRQDANESVIADIWKSG